METKDFINIVAPEHSRTSCSDDNLFNGFYYDGCGENLDRRYYPRCKRCAYLELMMGRIALTTENREIISELI